MTDIDVQATKHAPMYHNNYHTNYWPIIAYHNNTE